MALAHARKYVEKRVNRPQNGRGELPQRTVAAQPVRSPQLFRIRSERSHTERELFAVMSGPLRSMLLACAAALAMASTASAEIIVSPSASPWFQPDQLAQHVARELAPGQLDGVDVAVDLLDPSHVQLSVTRVHNPGQAARRDTRVVPIDADSRQRLETVTWLLVAMIEGDPPEPSATPAPIVPAPPAPVSSSIGSPEGSEHASGPRPRATRAGWAAIAAIDENASRRGFQVGARLAVLRREPHWQFGAGFAVEQAPGTATARGEITAIAKLSVLETSHARFLLGIAGGFRIQRPDITIPIGSGESAPVQLWLVRDAHAQLEIPITRRMNALAMVGIEAVIPSAPTEIEFGAGVEVTWP